MGKMTAASAGRRCRGMLGLTGRPSLRASAQCPDKGQGEREEAKGCLPRGRPNTRDRPRTARVAEARARGHP
eukprot:9357508-Pyramimonas_sp.AAC.1